MPYKSSEASKKVVLTVTTWLSSKHFSQCANLLVLFVLIVILKSFHINVLTKVEESSTGPMEYLWWSTSRGCPCRQYKMNLFQCYVWIKTLKCEKKTPQARQAIILIKSYLLVSGLFVKSIFHSKCHISQSFAMQIGWDIYLKYTWDFFVVPWHTNLIGVRGREDGWRLCEVGCQGTMRGFNVVLYLCEISNDHKWQIPYGFKSRHNQHTNKQTAHRYRHHRSVHIWNDNTI